MKKLGFLAMALHSFNAERHHLDPPLPSDGKTLLFDLEQAEGTIAVAHHT